ncbi:MAG: LamG protein, partial [Akkermansiaceae bacterium]|nr:LamG protein [Akkermansiaceae bacterium]
GNPVAWFRFNERLSSGLVVDSAENAAPHDGSLIGPVVNTGTSGFIDGAATFGGASGVLSDKIVDLGTVEAGYTVEAVVRNDPDSGSANRAIAAQQDLSGTGRLILAVDDTGVVNSNLGGGVRKNGDKTVAAKSWSHLILVVDALNTELRWYLDGVFAGTSKDGKNPDGTAFDPTTLFESSQGAWTIGVHKTLVANFWKGDIDELAVYDKLLDDPNADSDLSDSLVASHRDAWWGETSGLLESSLSVPAVDPGGSTDLNLRVGPDVTSVSIDHGVGAVAIVNGRAVTSLKPSTTTTYTITLTGSGGTTTKTVTVTVNGTPVDTPLQVTATSISGGNFIITFRGAASSTYAVKGSPTLDAFADSYGTVTTDATGAATVSIAIDATKKRQFFRLEGPQ